VYIRSALGICGLFSCHTSMEHRTHPLWCAYPTLDTTGLRGHLRTSSRLHTTVIDFHFHHRFVILDHFVCLSPPYSDEVKNRWSCISTPPYLCMMCCLVKNQGLLCLYHVYIYMYLCSRLGVVISILVTDPKGRVFKPGRGDGFLRATKIRSTRCMTWEVTLETPCR
jgi:hypothetical protein